MTQVGSAGHISVHVLISGRVQGVGYRAWTERRARELGLAGFVRNRASGDVEALFIGPEQAVRAMLEACSKGPRSAAVSTVKTLDPIDWDGLSFDVLSTV